MIIPIRTYIYAGLIAVLLAGGWYYGHTQYNAGQSSVQAKWDKVTAQQMADALTASESARATENNQAIAFSDISTKYLEATSHEYPSIANTLPGAVRNGTVRLRHDCPAPAASDRLPTATASARRADAAYTSALAQRIEDSISAIRVGEASDARERQLGAQVTALQDILKAERTPKK